ncbi:MAG: phosphopentomutase [Bacilli bacterium]|nr:phosphopentomutase [Bacilli bacterium]
MKYKRVFLIVLDSVGVGSAKDSDKYGDGPSNTLGHIIEKTSVKLPNLEKMGLLNILDLSEEKTLGYYTKALPISNGKDSLTGHLELMGLKTDIAPKTFAETGFPKELIEAIEYETGRHVIGNCSENGEKIIERLGVEHMKTGNLIIYTSADSVLHIAAHESIIPVRELYRICEIVRKLTLNDEWRIGRIIANPFAGKPGSFVRTSNRHDFALDPNEKTVLDNLKDKGYDVLTIGKICDIFNNRGITAATRTTDNLDGIKKLVKLMKLNFKGLSFTNLNDFDTNYGHRRDVEGYSKSLSEFDKYLPNIVNSLKLDDLLIITADHGNDPTYIGTDHTRENVPVLIFSRNFNGRGELPYLQSFADIGATIADNFGVQMPKIGKSFLEKLK